MKWVAALFALGACGNTSLDAAKSFLGMWTCSGNYTNTITSPQMLSTSGTYHVTLDISENSDGTLAVVNHFEDGSTCTKRATVSGKTASFTGQSCPVNGGMATETYTMGSWMLSGGNLLESGTGQVMGTVDLADGGAETLAATQTFNATCLPR